jgi:hypothetical protein
MSVDQDTVQYGTTLHSHETCVASLRQPHRAPMNRKSSRNRTLVFKWCIVHHEFVPRGRSITAAYYTEVLTRLRENVRRRRPQKMEGWPDPAAWQCVQSHGDGSSAVSWLRKRNHTHAAASLYSPDLAPVTSGCSLNWKRGFGVVVSLRWMTSKKTPERAYVR